jgi:hypothetical protein
MRRRLDLDAAFCLEYRRTVGNDGVVRFANRLLQIEVGQVYAQAVVKVQEHRDGTCTCGTVVAACVGTQLPRNPRRPVRREPSGHPG